MTKKRKKKRTINVIGAEKFKPGQGISFQIKDGRNGMMVGGQKKMCAHENWTFNKLYLLKVFDEPISDSWQGVAPVDYEIIT